MCESEIDPADGTRPLPRLFVLGDSISIHYHYYLADCLKNAVEVDRKRTNPIGGYSAGVGETPRCESNGGDSRLVLAFLKSWESLYEGHCEVLLVNCGLHDIKRDRVTLRYQVPIVDYECNLIAIVEAARKVSKKLIWVKTTPVDDGIHEERGAGLSYTRRTCDVERYNCIADKVMRGSGIPIINLDSVSGGDGSAGYIDHVHFSPRIRRLQACFIGGFVNYCLSLPDSRWRFVGI